MSTTQKKWISFELFLKHLSNQPYRDQAIWFLNHCPKVQNLESAEQVYQIYQSYCRVVVQESSCDDARLESKTKSIQSNVPSSSTPITPMNPTTVSEIQAHWILEHAHSPVTQSEFRTFLSFLKGIHPHDSKTKVSLVDILLCFYFFPQLKFKLQANIHVIPKNHDKEDLKENEHNEAFHPPNENDLEESEYDCLSWMFHIHDSKLEKDIQAAQILLEDTKSLLQAAIEARMIAIQNQTKAELAEELANREKEESHQKYHVSILEANKAFQAQEEANAALNHVKEQEAIFQSNIMALKHTAQDDRLGIVKRNKAKAELALLEIRDPLPLRKARIECENALKHLEKMSRKAKVASEEVEKSQILFEKAAASAREAKDAALVAATEAEYAIPVARSKLAESQAMLEALMNRKTKNVTSPNTMHHSMNCDDGNMQAFGSLFYMDRELKEAAKFLPQSKLEQIKAQQAKVMKQSKKY